MSDPNIPNPYQQQPGQPGQPQPGQPYPGQPYPYQPPKQKHTARNILIVLAVLGVLFCGGCLAIVGIGANEVDKAVKEEEKNDTPTAIEEGKAFTHDDYAVAAGWKVGDDGLGDFEIKNMKVTNNGDEGRRSALLDITFEKGSTVVAEVTCSSKELSKGQSSTLDCFSSDDFTKDYDTVKVADSF